MVKQSAIAGPVSRATGFRLHTEMGNAGEDIWAAITGSTRLGRSRLSWRGGKPAPVDVVDFPRRIAYQIKVMTDPSHRIAFSGAHKNVKGTRGGGKGGQTLPRYVGTPEEKLDDIKKWLAANELEGVLIVMLLDEDANRAIVYGKLGVHNATINEMEPLGVIDNDTGTWFVPAWAAGGIEKLGLPIPREVSGLPRFPDIPMFLRSSTSGEVAPEIVNVQPMFRREQPVHVMPHRRRA